MFQGEEVTKSAMRRPEEDGLFTTIGCHAWREKLVLWLKQGVNNLDEDQLQLCNQLLGGKIQEQDANNHGTRWPIKTRIEEGLGVPQPQANAYKPILLRVLSLHSRGFYCFFSLLCSTFA